MLNAVRTQQEIDDITLGIKMYLLTINGVSGWVHYSDAINTYSLTNEINPKNLSDMDLLQALEEHGVKDWVDYDAVLLDYHVWVAHVALIEDYYEYDDFKN